MSLPSWERGLKCIPGTGAIIKKDVAPFVGAWIEIQIHSKKKEMLWMSLPSWERGLKLLDPNPVACKEWSLPSWERGLKCTAVKSKSRPLSSLPSWERGLKSSLLVICAAL